ncbi:MAG: peptide-methionine (S)-S-oxide reductase MsrA [Bryobacteraceae bacterium]
MIQKPHNRGLLPAGAALFFLAAGACSGAGAVDLAHFPNPAVDEAKTATKGRRTAVFSAGCFWCAEAVFEQLAGVVNVTSGYTGGTAAEAHYHTVGAGGTNHAESVRIVYDPSKITYGTLLKVFMSVANDPTTKDRQGPDWGHQYRSAIWYADAEQEKTARAYVQQLTAAKVFNAPIVTEISPLKVFYPAEDYHQHYVQNHPLDPYVVANSIPKIKALKKAYPELLKK